MKDILIGFAVVVGAAAFAVVLVFSFSERTLGSAPSGLGATMASSSKQTVTNTAKLLFATSTNCAARIIGTTSTPITLTFTDKNGRSPDATTGFVQQASTTVVYDGATFGCDAVKVFAPNSTTIEAAETF